MQIKQMERKLDIYKKYHNKFGVSLSKNQRQKLMDTYDEPTVELLLGRKLFNKR